MACYFLLQGIFPTQSVEPTPLRFPALAGKFFTTAPSSIKLKYKKKQNPKHKVLLDGPCRDALWSKDPLPHGRSSRNSTVSPNQLWLCCFSGALATKGKKIVMQAKDHLLLSSVVFLAREIVISVNTSHNEF